MRNIPFMALASVFALSLVAADFAEARGGRGGGGGGMRGGGGGGARMSGGGGFSGGRGAATSIQRPSGGSLNRGGSAARNGNVARNGNFNGNGNFNNNRNVNANVNRNVNVNVDNGWGGCCGGGFNHPVAAGVAIAGAAAVTAAAVGSMYYSLPPNCSPYGGYYNCGGTYYQPQYSGSDVTYVVVNNPG